ncbi:MAG TPA: GAF domain-containing protein [Terriglobales bacterium]|nr:GAF domain-containing protein [Terriglobales bacterium]
MSRGASPPEFSAENSILGRDRRRVARHRAHTPAYANLSGSAQGAEVSLCEILNVTENGMCIQASSQLKTNRLLPLCLELSQTRARIHVVGHVVWSEASGKTGIRFPEMSEACMSQLREWLDANQQAGAASQAENTNAENVAPRPRLQPKPGSAVAYSSLVSEWSEIEREVEGCGPDLDPALHIVVQRALTMTWASGTAIALINKLRPSEMICRARAGTDAPELGAILEAGSGFSGECVRSGTAIVCDDTEYDSRVDRRSCRALGIRSILASPVKRGDEIIGIIEVFSPEPAAFWENDVTILRRLAEVVAHAVRRAEHARADVLSFPSGDYFDSETGGTLQSFDNPELLSPRNSFRRKTLLLLTGIACVTAVLWLLAPWIAKLSSSTSNFASLPAAEADSSPDSLGTLSFKDIKKLALSGNVGAEYSLAMRYANGDRVKEDDAQARQWFLQAAERGHIRAQAKVAASFWGGRGGPQDYRKAYFWALLAQAGGDETSPAIVMSCAAHLTPAQTSTEQRHAEQWLHAHHIGQASDSAQ